MLTFLKGVPPLDNVEGAGHITGRTSTFTATSWHDARRGLEPRTLTLTNCGFHIAHAEIRPTPAQFSGRVTAIWKL